MNHSYQLYVYRLNRSIKKLARLRKRANALPHGMRGSKEQQRVRVKLMHAIEKLRLRIVQLEFNVQRGVALGVLGAGLMYAHESSAQMNFVATPDSLEPLAQIHQESGDEVKPTFVDIDADGDQDLFVGLHDGGIAYYANVGDSVNANFEARQGALNPFNDFGGDYYVNVSFADIDNDGDQDAFVSNTEYDSDYEMFVYQFENVGDSANPVFQQVLSNPHFASKVFSEYSQLALADIDGDGDFDVMIGEGDPGGILFMKNIGTPDSALFEEQPDSTNPFANIPDSEETKITFADMDGDDDLDLLTGEGDGYVYYYENIGVTIDAPAFQLDQSNLGDAGDSIGRYIKPYLVDLDGDKDYDLVVGNSNGDLLFFENDPTVTAAEEIAEHEDLKIYPNPTTGKVSISSLVDVKRVKCFDNRGQLMTTSWQDDGIDMESLPSGIYTLEIQQENGVVIQKSVSKL